MSNPQLVTALPEVGGLRVFSEPMDNNVFYPKPDAPGPTPCLSLVWDGSSLWTSYLYVTVEGQVRALPTGISNGGS